MLGKARAGNGLLGFISLGLRMTRALDIDNNAGRRRGALEFELFIISYTTKEYTAITSRLYSTLSFIKSSFT